MLEIKELVRNIVCSIADNPDYVVVDVQELDNGTLYEVTASAEDVGKIIGTKGRVAKAIRTVCKAAGAKHGVRVMFNVMNKPVG